MSSVKFHKYQGTGNDFIMIDNRTGFFQKDLSVIQHLCSRKFGIGSDGLILIETPGSEDSSNIDFIMDFYNPDGSQSFCGNGSRCAVAYCHWLGIIESTCLFEAIDGVHEATIDTPSGLISIHMQDVGAIDEKVPLQDFYTHTGSPHYIRMVDNAAEYDLLTLGKSIRYSDEFRQQNGTNVNIVEPRGLNQLFMRTYERGVENETLSCGTGVTACALAYGKIHESTSITVETKGGTLNVTFEEAENGYKNIWLTGPAKQVFEGIVNI